MRYIPHAWCLVGAVNKACGHIFPSFIQFLLLFTCHTQNTLVKWEKSFFHRLNQKSIPLNIFDSSVCDDWGMLRYAECDAQWKWSYHAYRKPETKKNLSILSCQSKSGVAHFCDWKLRQWCVIPKQSDSIEDINNSKSRNTNQEAKRSTVFFLFIRLNAIYLCSALIKIKNKHFLLLFLRWIFLSYWNVNKSFCWKSYLGTDSRFFNGHRQLSITWWWWRWK